MYRIIAIFFFGLFLTSCNNQEGQTAGDQTKTTMSSQSKSQSSDEAPVVPFENEEARAVFTKAYKQFSELNDASKEGNTSRTKAIATELNQTIAESKALMSKLTEQDKQILNKFIFSIEGRINKMMAGQ